MLAGHPHRPASDPPPEVDAALIGPGWRAAFTSRTDPGDTLWLPDTIRSIGIPIRYRAPSEVGTLRPAGFATHRRGGGTESKWVATYPGSLDLEGEADTLSVAGVDVSELEGASLHLIGIGWQYTRFRKSSRTHFPWPNFGVSGEGAYGYFDGSAKSRSVRIVVEDGG